MPQRNSKKAGGDAERFEEGIRSSPSAGSRGSQIDGDDILLRVGDKVELKMLRSAVSRVKGE